MSPFRAMGNQFWHLHRSMESPRKRAGWDDDRIETQQVECPLYPGHKRGGKRLTDLSVVLPKGKVEDFVWTWYAECLVQDRVLDLFRSLGFTGYEVKPVTARFKSGAETPPRLWELVLTGWGGMARPESGIRLDEAESCGACGFRGYTGLVDPRQLIDEAMWDGNDFFMVWPLPRFMFVTEQVVQSIREHKLTGAYFTPVSELEQSNGYAPGRLRYWMPESRARELGEPLGIY